MAPRSPAATCPTVSLGLGLGLGLRLGLRLRVRLGLRLRVRVREKRETARQLLTVPPPHRYCNPPLLITPGDIKDLEKTGAKQKAHGRIVLRTGVCNVNAWLLTITYGMCFGVELTLNSVS